MSARHRQTSPGGKSKLSQTDRKADLRKDRHAGRFLLKQDPETIPSTTVVRKHEVPLQHSQATASTATEKSKQKHWKEPFWKRRKAVQRKRNETLSRLLTEGPPPMVFQEVPDTELRYPAAV